MKYIQKFNEKFNIDEKGIPDGSFKELSFGDSRDITDLGYDDITPSIVSGIEKIHKKLGIAVKVKLNDFSIFKGSHVGREEYLEITYNSGTLHSFKIYLSKYSGSWYMASVYINNKSEYDTDVKNYACDDFEGIIELLKYLCETYPFIKSEEITESVLDYGNNSFIELPDADADTLLKAIANVMNEIDTKTYTISDSDLKIITKYLQKLEISSFNKEVKNHTGGNKLLCLYFPNSSNSEFLSILSDCFSLTIRQYKSSWYLVCLRNNERLGDKTTGMKFSKTTDEKYYMCDDTEGIYELFKHLISIYPFLRQGVKEGYFDDFNAPYKQIASKEDGSKDLLKKNKAQLSSSDFNIIKRTNDKLGIKYTVGHDNYRNQAKDYSYILLKYPDLKLNVEVKKYDDDWYKVETSMDQGWVGEGGYPSPTYKSFICDDIEGVVILINDLVSGKIVFIKESFIEDFNAPYIDVTDNNEYDKFLYDQEKGKSRREIGISQRDISMINKYHTKLGIPCDVTDYSKLVRDPSGNFISLEYNNSDDFPGFAINLHKFEGDLYVVDLHMRNRIFNPTTDGHDQLTNQMYDDWDENTKDVKNGFYTTGYLYNRYICDDIEGFFALLKDLIIKYPFIKTMNESVVTDDFKGDYKELTHDEWVEFVKDRDKVDMDDAHFHYLQKAQDRLGVKYKNTRDKIDHTETAYGLSKDTPKKSPLVPISDYDKKWGRETYIYCTFYYCRNRYINVYRYEDDWFLVELMDEDAIATRMVFNNPNSNRYVYYLCDEISGVIELIKFLISQNKLTNF